MLFSFRTSVLAMEASLVELVFVAHSVTVNRLSKCVLDHQPGLCSTYWMKLVLCSYTCVEAVLKRCM